MRILLLVLSLLSVLGFAMTLQDAAAATPVSQRQKVLDFDDETIEGLNKRPLDSLSQISEKDRRRHKPHLYRKRTGFRSETSETMRALRYTQ
jgi:ABC-type microcin C transport system permease subunit YejB